MIILDIKLKVGQRIKELRKENQITQENLALITGLDRTYINSVENGKRNISIINLDKVAKGLKTDLKDFFDKEFFLEEQNEF